MKWRRWGGGEECWLWCASEVIEGRRTEEGLIPLTSLHGGISRARGLGRGILYLAVAHVFFFYILWLKDTYCKDCELNTTLNRGGDENGKSK